MRKYILIFSLITLCPLGAWCEDGDTFIAQTPEGCSMTFKVVSEQEKTVCVGSEDNPAIDVGTTGKITIPAVVNGYQVTRIGARAFVRCDQIEEIVIPNGITSIGDVAFDSCEKLQAMEIPEGVISIGGSAFAWCEELKSITIPSSVTEFGTWILLECRSLRSVHVGILSPSPVWMATFSVNYPPQPDNGTDYFPPEELYNQATLYVPKGCKEKYENTEGWNLFANIVEEKVNAVGTVSTSYHPMFWGDIRKRWSGYCVLKNGEEFRVPTFERQDSVIGGKTYSVIEYQGKDTLLFLERQEGLKVYRYDENTQAEVLMIDYSLNVGEEVEVDGGVRLRVVETGSAYEKYPMYGLRNSKMMKLQGVDDETLEDVWIEGVGSIYWGVLPRGMMDDVDKMYVANVSFSFSEGNAAFPVNTERYKACLLSYRKLTDAELDRVEKLGSEKREYLSYILEDDTLYVTGRLDLKSYDYQIECLIDGENVDINMYMIDVLDFFATPHLSYIEAKFSGFKEECYQVKASRWIGASPKYPDPDFSHVYKVSYNGGEPVEVVREESFGKSTETEIDGLKYVLYSDHTAMIANGNQWEGELDIPEQVTYNGEVYTVNSLEWLAFMSCKTLTKVRIPKTISSIKHYADYDDCKNPFVQCTALEAIEVDEENPWMCSVDGVLFNKDKTWLYCYPAGAKRKVYHIPEGVTWLGGGTFAYNPYLTEVYMPNSVTRTAFQTFAGCKNLHSIRLSENLDYLSARDFENCESLYFLDIPKKVSSFEESVFRWSPIKTLVIRGSFNELRTDTFYSMDEEVVIYVQKSEIEKFKKVFSGTVKPLEEYVSDYRPFIEEGKVWKVGHVNPGQTICDGLSTYYFEGDTIVGGKPCKRMMCRTEMNEDLKTGVPTPTKYVGAFHEVNHRVYCAFPNDETLYLLYDFGAIVGETIELYDWAKRLGGETSPFLVSQKEEENTDSFKGVRMEIDGGGIKATWMEGVGGYYGPLHNIGDNYPLLTCTVGDEVLYRNTSYLEGEYDETSEAKKRVDFTHVVKKKPKAPQRRVEEQEAVAISGEYSQTVLMVDLSTLQDVYAVTITDPSGQSIYAKDVKTNRVLGLNIDISNYTGDAYTITLENEDEIFTGKFCLSDLTDIRDVTTPSTTSTTYYDLTGHPVTTLTKGIYIRNGKKVLVK